MIDERAIARGIGWGALVGGIIGLAMQMSYCRRNSCDSQGALILPFMTGAGIGLGAATGASIFVRRTVYRAP